jgi:hypothetical protein
MLHGLLFTVTSRLLYEKFCASENDTYCLFDGSIIYVYAVSSFNGSVR